MKFSRAIIRELEPEFGLAIYLDFLQSNLTVKPTSITSDISILAYTGEISKIRGLGRSNRKKDLIATEKSTDRCFAVNAMTNTITLSCTISYAI